MRTKSTLYERIQAEGHYVEYKLTINGVDIPATAIESIRLEGALFSAFGIGQANYRQANITLHGEIAPGDAVNVYARLVSLVDGATSEWMQQCALLAYGVTQVDEAYYRVTAYDILCQTEYKYKRLPTWEDTDMATVVEGICQDVGAELTIRAQELVPTYNVSDPGDLTAREILQHIAVAAGGNWITTYDGKLDLILSVIPETVYTVQPADIEFDTFDTVQPYRNFVGVELEGQTLVYRSPAGRTEEEWEQLKTTGRVLNTRCYFATQEMADNILAVLAESPRFYPYSANVNLDIAAEVGDGININGVESIYAAYQLEATGGRLFGSISASGTNNFAYLNPYTPEVEKRIAYIGEYTRAQISVAEGNIELEAEQRRIGDLEQQEAREAAEQQIIESIGSIQVQTDNIQSTVTELTQQGGALDQIQTQVTQTAEGLSIVTETIESLDNYVDTQNSYLTWDGTTATLTIGKSDFSVHTEIRPTGFAVVENGVDIMLASGEKLFIETGALEVGAGEGSYAKIGRYKWIDEGSNGFSLVYVG